MQDKRITSLDLSKSSTLAASTIYDVLENHSSPKLSTIQGLCDALDLEIRVCNGNNCRENDELTELISGLSKKKRETVKEFIMMLERYPE